MGTPSVFVQYMNGEHEEARRIDGLVPEVLRREDAVVMWDIRRERKQTISALRDTLSAHQILSARSLTVLNDQLPHRDSSAVRRFRVEMNLERLERDTPALLGAIGDYCTATLPTRDMMPWLDAQWDQVIERVTEAVLRKRSENGMRSHLEAIAVTSEMAEVVFGSLLDRFTEEERAAPYFTMVKRDPKRVPIHDKQHLLSVDGIHRFRSTHVSPHSATLYYDGHEALEEYDALMRVGPDKLLAFDVTCGKDIRDKLSKEYALPRYANAEVAIVRFNGSKGLHSNHANAHVLELPIFSSLKEPSWRAYEQCRFGTKAQYLESLRAVGWGKE